MTYISAEEEKEAEVEEEAEEEEVGNPWKDVTALDSAAATATDGRSDYNSGWTGGGWSGGGWSGGGWRGGGWSAEEWKEWKRREPVAEDKGKGKPVVEEDKGKGKGKGKGEDNCLKGRPGPQIGARILQIEEAMQTMGARICKLEVEKKKAEGELAAEVEARKQLEAEVDKLQAKIAGLEAREAEVDEEGYTLKDEVQWLFEQFKAMKLKADESVKERGGWVKAPRPPAPVE